MFSTFFEKLSGYLDQRFVITLWLPSLLFWVALLSLVLVWFDPSNALLWWQQQPRVMQVLLILLTLTWITFCARVLAAYLGSLIRFYEGYWEHIPGLRQWGVQGKQHYQNELARLAGQGEEGYRQIAMGFPPSSRPEQVMPTRLGNLLKNVELYPNVRYQIDGVVVWPRLYSVLPERLVQILGAAKAEMDMMMVVSFLSMAFAFLGGVLAMVLLPWYYPPLCALIGGGGAWIGYRGALRSALPYAQLTKAAFDVYRGTLLKTMGWLEPTSYAEERQRWLHISQLWYRGAPGSAAGAHALGYPPGKQTEPGKEMHVKLQIEEPRPYHGII
jgi:hypothetical protein